MISLLAFLFALHRNRRDSSPGTNSTIRQRRPRRYRRVDLTSEKERRRRFGFGAQMRSAALRENRRQREQVSRRVDRGGEAGSEKIEKRNGPFGRVAGAARGGGELPITNYE